MEKRLRNGALLLVVAVLIISSCATSPPPPLWQETIPPERWSNLQNCLSEAGTNREELEKAFALAPSKLHPSLALLIERLPSIDRASCSGELLVRTVKLADSLRGTLPYAADLPEEIFQDYVLPLRVSQEPLEDFRPFFISELYPLVKDCTSVEGAAVIINRWCGSKVGFKPTQRRDQGPFETLKSGYGRCEEMMIFFSDACRSLCVPTREAWTPWWAFQDNNHAWTEIWTPEGWKYTGACEPRERLNQAWFTEPVKRAALVLASKQGPALKGENLYRSSPYHSLINVTGQYAQVSSLIIRLNSVDQPVADREVFISVFNFGALRPLARIKTDSLGIASLDLGKGDYVITWGLNDPNAVIHPHRPPQTSSLNLDISQPAELSPSFWLRCDP